MRGYLVPDLLVLDELGLDLDEGDVDTVKLEPVLGQLAQLFELLGFALEGQLPVADLLLEGLLRDLAGVHWAVIMINSQFKFATINIRREIKAYSIS
jgi:hypothetical protein